MKLLSFTTIVLCIPTLSCTPLLQRTGHIDLKIDVLENGTIFSQETDLDFDNKVVTFKVPKHNAVDASHEMTDYVRGYTMTCMDEACYLRHMANDDLPSMENLEMGMLVDYGKNKQLNDAEAEKIWNKWVITDGPLWTLEFLGVKMRTMVDKKPVFRIEKLPANAQILQGYVDEKMLVTSSVAKRHKREDTNVNACTCIGGKCPLMRYGLLRNTCIHIHWCKDMKCSDNKVVHIQNVALVHCMCCKEHHTTSTCRCFKCTRVRDGDKCDI